MPNLPPELYHEIALQFEHSQPSDIRSMHSWSFQHDNLEHYRACSHTRPLQGKPDVKTLRNLRLTSIAFNRAASPVLFRCIRMQWKPTQEITQSAFNNKVDRHLSGITATLAPFVKALQIGFRHYGSDKCFLLRPVPANFVNKDIPRRVIDHVSDLLARMSQLESFQIVLPGWASGYTGGGEATGHAPDLNLDLLTTLRTTLSSALSTNPCSHLTELRLSLPCTYDFVDVSENIPDSLLAQLKTLFLAITDATGPGGAKEYLIWAEEDDDGDDRFPFSNLQLAYPNTEHMEGIFSIVSRCHNLETLGLDGTQFLQADLMEWAPTLRGLKELYLKRVKLNSENLIKLLSPAKSVSISSSPLSKVWLELVDLTAGLWDAVFSHLLLCPSLEFFQPEDLSYARGSENFHLKMWSGRSWEDCFELLSLREEDEEAIRALRRALRRRAGGRDAYLEKFGTEQRFISEEDAEDR
ncbi:uncharacterized protein PAC_16675 [Phialocephala subalpina]|uniref:Uncharacterized protein n=1 Tax=Phialocephala subalpina TaxID=576137 RepID=A0A1L7XP26_9HELO|nr:uncharacterized protein PAC_16675 [Phialocephala subalpina]